jgi:hypothetical protein
LPRRAMKPAPLRLDAERKCKGGRPGPHPPDGLFLLAGEGGDAFGDPGRRAPGVT